MESTFDTSKLPAYFSVLNTGLAEIQDMLSMWKRVLGDDKWMPGTTILVDNRLIKPSYTYNASPKAVTEMLAAKSSKLGPARVAIIMPLDANDVYMREFEKLVNSMLSGINLQYFYSDVSALNWIYSGQPSTADH
jgi:hypothetical protein